MTASLRPTMRSILTIMMILSMAAGLSARVLAMDCCVGENPCETVETCCVERHDAASQPGNHHEGDGCPMEHHHHVCCSHGLSLGADERMQLRPTRAASADSRCRPEGDLPPDDLFLGTEKPPLI